MPDNLFFTCLLCFCIYLPAHTHWQLITHKLLSLMYNSTILSVCAYLYEPVSSQADNVRFVKRLFIRERLLPAMSGLKKYISQRRRARKEKQLYFCSNVGRAMPTLQKLTSFPLRVLRLRENKFLSLRSTKVQLEPSDLLLRLSNH